MTDTEHPDLRGLDLDALEKVATDARDCPDPYPDGGPLGRFIEAFDPPTVLKLISAARSTITGALASCEGGKGGGTEADHDRALAFVRRWLSEPYDPGQHPEWLNLARAYAHVRREPEAEPRDVVFQDDGGLWIRDPQGNCRPFDIHDYESLLAVAQPSPLTVPETSGRETSVADIAACAFGDTAGDAHSQSEGGER